MSAVTLLFFFSFPLLSSLGWGPIESAAVPRNQNAVVWLIAAGIASFPFLPFKHLLTTTAKPDRAAGFLPAERPRHVKPTEVLFSRTSPVYRKSDFKCWKGR